MNVGGHQKGDPSHLSANVEFGTCNTNMVKKRNNYCNNNNKNKYNNNEIHDNNNKKKTKTKLTWDLSPKPSEPLSNSYWAL